MLKQRAQTTEPKLEHHKELPLNQCSNATQECSKEQKSAQQAQGG
jgi:hypothetical protein